jgi:hypothetical protein
MNNSNIDLEPRLVEYLKRKKFYEENDINTVSLEKQYMITKNDLQNISDFKNNRKQQQQLHDNYDDDEDPEDELVNGGNDRMYVRRKVKNYDNDDLIDCTKARFPVSNNYDPRLERITEKIKKEKEANRTRHNTTDLAKSYDMYRRNFSSTASSDFSNEFGLDNIIDEMNAPIEVTYEASSNQNTNQLYAPPSDHHYTNNRQQQVRPPQHQAHVTPQIAYKQVQHFQPINTGDKQFCNSIGSGYSYRKPNAPDLSRSHIFQNNKPGLNNNREDREERNVNLNALYNGVGNNDGGFAQNIDYENFVKYGYPTSKARSLGFENASDHYFQFIDSDIQDPKHVIFDRPTSTRIDNKTTARSKQRDIY